MALTELITPQWLKDRYLVGINLTTDDGQPYPDAHYEFAIETAIAYVESELDLVLADGVNATERHDHFVQSSRGFYFMTLRKRPVRQVTAIAVKYGSQNAATLPVEWAYTREPLTGVLQIVPSGPSGITASQFFYMGLQNRPYTPGWFEVSYAAGYTNEDDFVVPADILEMIGNYASWSILDTAGDLIAGAGIASQSVSVPGVSTSKNTTSSATNSGYGARAIQFKDRFDRTLKSAFRKYRPIEVGMI